MRLPPEQVGTADADVPRPDLARAIASRTKPGGPRCPRPPNSLQANEIVMGCWREINAQMAHRPIDTRFTGWNSAYD